MDENFSETSTKLAACLAERCAAELQRAIADEFPSLLQRELAKNKEVAEHDMASSLLRILEAGNQVEILTALLRATEPFAPRAGLLVLRGNAFFGWQSRGMEETLGFSRLSVPMTDRHMNRIVRERRHIKVPTAELGPNLRAIAASEGDANLFPLVIRDHIAGVLYADSCEISSLSAQISVIQALTMVACLAIQVSSLHKSAAVAAQPVSAASVATAHPVKESPSMGFSQARGAAATAAAPSMAAAAAVSAVPSAPAVSSSLAGGNGTPENELHAKARRFAKLLVEEIQLYNRAKVVEGRSKRDLYQCLKDDIDKSRATYQRRYGELVRETDYFTQELIRILAGNDRSLLGSSFPG